jgi:DNA repair exonuclease SbcCD ATPase subunit
MRRNLWLFTALLLIFAGCGKQNELEQQNKQLQQQLTEKDKFIEEVTSTINDIHNTIESTWAMEKGVVQQTTAKEGAKPENVAEVKKQIVDRIAAIRDLLSANRKRAIALERKLKIAGVEYAGLEKMVADLKQNLDDREKAIADLNTRVQGLQNDVQQKTQIIADRENTIAQRERTIGEQTKQLNTVYYVVGKRDDLEKKGVITDQGGFLWGLLGSTTVLAANFDDGQFQPLDKSSENTIQVRGKIEKIIPQRDTSSYVEEQSGDGTAVLKIVRPDAFWHENHLVIITD